MAPLNQISHIERQLHAAKGRLTRMKNDYWIDTNYRGKPADQEPIRQTEAEITEHRKTLAKLYQSI